MDALVVHESAPGAPDKPLSGFSAVDVTDVVLATASQRNTLSITLEPCSAGHEMRWESDEGTRTALTMTGTLGEAVAARIALLAGLDPSIDSDQMGRLGIEIGGTRTDLFLLLGAHPLGLSLEVRRIVGAADVNDDKTVPRIFGSGDRLGPYRLGACLGQGGHGTVFSAEHEALGKPVAVKILHPSIACRPDLATLLLREGRLATRARSPRIVNVTDFGATSGGTYLVMELIEWPTLATLLDAGPIRPEQAIAIARQILLGLDAAHAQGVVHRDLKPSNVFVSRDGEVKIADFGTAKLMNAAVGSDPHERVLRGSPHYVSPEQCQGLSADTRCDIYAVGCILFEMLTGHVPFIGDTIDEILLRHVQAPIPTPTSQFGALPEAMDEAIVRSLAKRPERRYQSAAEMIGALDQISTALHRKVRRR